MPRCFAIASEPRRPPSRRSIGRAALVDASRHWSRRSAPHGAICSKRWTTDRYVAVIDRLVRLRPGRLSSPRMAASPGARRAPGARSKPWRSLSRERLAARGDVPDEQLHDLRIRPNVAGTRLRLPRPSTGKRGPVRRGGRLPCRRCSASCTTPRGRGVVPGVARPPAGPRDRALRGRRARGANSAMRRRAPHGFTRCMERVPADGRVPGGEPPAS